MNQAISALVAVFSCLLVCALAAGLVHAVMGQYSLLVWIALGFAGVMTLMARVNS